MTSRLPEVHLNLIRFDLTKIKESLKIVLQTYRWCVSILVVYRQMHKLKRMVLSGSGWEETHGRDLLCSLVDGEILRCVWMKKFILFHSISFSSYWIVGPLLLLFSSGTLKVSTFQIGCFHLWEWHSRKPRLKEKSQKDEFEVTFSR